MGNMMEQLERRQEINTAMKIAILQDLQQLLHEHHALVRLFKTALERMPHDNYKVVIRADKRPLMFWQEDDGYHFNIKMINPLNGEETTKKISSCNPKWKEIVQMLLPGQTSSDRHDITARVFKHKIRSLMNLKFNITLFPFLLILLNIILILF
ncbi:uncharacterized protein LOC119688554 [Teleopsis dalmanni]|uniref:uncharacterized protein LOC119688554 n=1 Tax=Teleopsis dalmanni TaxID=139649 RepID=UPI0018CED190|nr:uncharacterized protein LOC119688554 [Teleopsis dalmanni]